MSNPSNQGLIILIELAKAVSSSSQWFEQFTLEHLGIALPAPVSVAPQVQQKLLATQSAATALETASRDLAAALDTADTGQLISSAVRTADGLRVFSQHLIDFVNSLKAATQSNVSDATQRNQLLQALDSVPILLLNQQFAQQIYRLSPMTLYVLSILGLADWKRKYPAVADGVFARPYLDRSLHLERIKDLIKSPEQHFRNALGWGNATFDPTPFFEVYRNLLGEESGAGIGMTDDGHPYLSHGPLYVRRLLDGGQVALEFLLRLSFEQGADVREKISEEWGALLEASFSLSGSVGATLRPPFHLAIVPPAASAGGKVSLRIDRNESARPWSIFEAGGLIGFSVNNVGAGVGLSAEVKSSGQLEFEPRLFAEFNQARIKIGSEDADSFLAKLIAGAKLEAIFDLALEFIPSKGLVVRAAGGVEIMIPIHKDLGPLRLDQFFLGLYIKEDGALELETSIGLGANLGPLKAVVERMGVKSLTRFTDSAASEFGNIESGLRFKLPTGVGLSLDAGIIKGGGYLYIDADRGEYAGALELTFSEIISLKAIGLISTRLPDGSKGFSLLIIITVEFGTGIQLGFGFTLLGVGGLLGLNRRTAIEPLAASIRTGAVESVMFPQNIIENAPRIISDLRAFFPTQEGTFLIGPMVKIGWGTPTLISLSMGIIIEVPDPTITILGVLKVVLPDERLAVLKLQVNFIGRIEFSNQLAWFYAELFDSRILFITLEGGMGVLVNWGSQANFVVSIGGFHPNFQPPPLPFPEPPRIAVSILNTAVARVRIEGYFAVTSNSVQFGARAELFFGVSEFRIEGHLGFDALFIFSPFYFSFSLSVSLSVKVFGIGLFSVGFSGMLEGPTPWHIKGKGSISLLFIKISVPFEHTWGEERNTALPPVEVLPLLIQELEAISNWQANLPKGVHLLVSLRQLGDKAEDQLVLHPVGSLSVSQRKLPLGMVLEKFGNQTPSDAKELNVSVATGFTKLSDQKEQFAIGHFKDLKEKDKLSKPAFQPLTAGLNLSAGGEQTRSSGATARSIRYEKLIIDGVFRQRFVLILQSLLRLIVGLLQFSQRNAVRQNELSNARQLELRPLDQQILLRPNQYTVVQAADLRPASDLQTVTFDSQVEAQDYLQREYQINPAKAISFQVVPATEVNLRA